MSDRTYVILSKAIACSGLCYMVTINEPWWGLLCLLFGAYMGQEKKEMHDGK